MAHPAAPTATEATTTMTTGGNDIYSPATSQRKRAGTAASVTQSLKDVVLNSDPAPGFIAATAQATSKAPTFGEIRGGSFGEGGWVRGEKSGRGSGSSKGKSGSWSGGSGKRGAGKGSRDSGRDGYGDDMGQGGAGLFAPVTEEPGRISEDVRRPGPVGQVEAVKGEDEGETLPRRGPHDIDASEPYHDTRYAAQRPHTGEKHARRRPSPPPRVSSTGYIPPPTLPWTQSTTIALKGFGRWCTTPLGFLITLYGLNVVAWGGMLFLLLCNAAPAMCHAPIPTAANQEKLTPAQALGLPGPYYVNCNDINSPRRVWIEIDSQILNALFCVTGFGLVPWRFRDLWYILRYRWATMTGKGLEERMYGIRVLAGIHRGWFRLPGSETLDEISSHDYAQRLAKDTDTSNTSDLEAALSPTHTTSADHDIRLPLPPTKTPSPPATSIRAPATQTWLMDFFIWCQVWNTFFQCCLCGFMWGMDRYDRPPWSTGLFVALACIIAGVGGVVSFVQGRRVKRMEGVAVAPVSAGIVTEGVGDPGFGVREAEMGMGGGGAVGGKEEGGG